MLVNYCFLLVSAHVFNVAAVPNEAFGTSITMARTLVPAKVSVPGLLNPGAVPPSIACYWPKSKKNGSSLGPAKNL